MDCTRRPLASLAGAPARAREIALRFATVQDHVWIRQTLDEYERFVGRPRRELEQRMREPLPSPAPRGIAKLVAGVLDRAYRPQVEAALPPVEARKLVFGAAARRSPDRDPSPAALLTRLAQEQGITPAQLEDALFADVPGERRVRAPATALSPTEIALRANLALVQSLLRSAYALRIEVQGNARAVVQHAKRRGLICTVTARGTGADASLAISGPFSLFSRTLVYGRALAGLVPHLAWCTRYRLEGEALQHGEVRRFVLRSGDPIFPAPASKLHDSRLEERFEREFRRAAPGFDVIREPEPVPAGDTLIFPDFALQLRDAPARRWLLEIVGFWTADYLARKLARLRAARISNLILCIDAERNCGERELPPGVPVIRYRRRIDPREVLRVLTAGSGHPA